MSSISLHFERRFLATAEVVWKAMSNTDAFNRRAGLDFEFETEVAEDGRVVVTGSTRRFGQTLRWTEEPVRFIAPDQFEVIRNFHSGPVAEVYTRFRILEDPRGCTLHYDVDLEPRSWILRPLVAADVALQTRRTLANTLDAVVDAVESDAPHFDPPPPLSAAALLRLTEGCEAVIELDVRRALIHIVKNAPLAVQHRIQPLRLAQQLELPVEDVIEGCLQAAEEGVLELVFLLLCPVCLGAKQSVKTLNFTSERVHCDTCNIHYDVTLSDHIEVAFRVAPALRREEFRVDCRQSPSFSPHVWAQAPVRPGETLVLEVPMPLGTARIDAAPHRGAMHIEVVPEGPSEVVADLTDEGMLPRRVEVGEGPVTLHLRSRLSGWATVSAARTPRMPFSMTVAQFLQHPHASAWARAHGGVEGAPTEGVVVAIAEEPSWGPRQGTSPWRQAIREHGANHVLLANGVALAWVDTAEQALRLVNAYAMDGRSAGVAAGSVFVLRGPVGSILVGLAVDAALAAVRSVGWGRVALDPAFVESSAFARARSAWPGGVEVIPGWGLRPALLRFPRGSVGVESRRGARVPNQVGPYVLGAEVGRGGMGVVHAAQEDETGKSVVVKLLRDDLARDFRYAAAFYQEARLAWSVRHPHVVNVLDWGMDGGRLYLAMEKLAGRTVSEIVEGSGALAPPMLLNMADRLLEALAAIHDRGIVHRDLKPSNVLLTERGPVIIDFGIAFQMADIEMFPAGSKRWMSPEQERGFETDWRSDLYQLGLLLCWAGTGEWPWPGRTSEQRFQWRAQHPLECLPAGLPLELEPVVLRALQYAPDDRYENARSMRAAIIR